MFYQYVKYQSKTILLINITTYLFSKIASLAQSGERQTEDLKVPSSILGDRIYFLTGHFFVVTPLFTERSIRIPCPMLQLFCIYAATLTENLTNSIKCVGISISPKDVSSSYEFFKLIIVTAREITSKENFRK